MKILMMGCICVALLAGCATPQVTTKSETTRVFDKPFDSVWAAGVATLTADHPIQVVEKASGIIESQVVGRHTDALKSFANKPSIFLGLWGDGRERISIYVKAQTTNSTTVRIIGHFEGFEWNTTKAWYVWPSTGAYEEAMMNRIAAHLQGGPVQ